MPADGLHWVFGYGSLIWNPGFAHLAAVPARLSGAHRRLCVYSHRHRGTIEHPGLVFGLMPGGSCHGMAFAVEAADWPEAYAYLVEREQDAGVYREVTRALRLRDGQTVPGLVFMADPNHPQYAGRLPVAQQIDIVRGAHGQSGANIDYVLATVDKLDSMGIVDRGLTELAVLLRALGAA